MSRSSIRSIVAMAMVLVAIPAAAADNGSNGNTTDTTPAAVGASIPTWTLDQPASSSPTLKVLFGSYAVVQGMDVYSTIKAKQNGAREMNPMMDGGSLQMVGMKLASTAVSYAVVQKLAKKNRKAAIVTMVVLNGLTAAVAANNMRNAGR